MATIKSYTDLSQSRKLAEVLPVESADMCYRIVAYNPNDTHEYQPYCFVGTFESDIPCWSLAALLELLELPTLEKNGIGKGKTGWMVTHYDVNGMRYDTTYYDNAVDACYEMILILKENNRL